MKLRQLVLDCEMNQPSGRVIQIGVCVLEGLEVIPGSKMGWFVRLPPGEPVSTFITGLTGITQETLDSSGLGIEEVLGKLSEYKEAHGCHCNPVVWGQGDARAIRDTAMGVGVDWAVGWWGLFGRREEDVKTVWRTWRAAHGLGLQGGLARALTGLGLEFEGRKHNAVDDAYNTARLAGAMRRRFFMEGEK